MQNYSIQIKEHHLDTFGHVNNATYLQIFEEARWEIITARGYGLPEIMAAKKGPVVLEANIKFLKELKLRDTIQVTFEPIEMNGKIGKCIQRMINSAGEVSCEALFTVGFFDLETRRLILPTEQWLQAVKS